MAIPEPVSDDKPRLLFCTGRPSNFTAVLPALRQVFTVTVIDNAPAAAEAVERLPDVLIVEDRLPGGSGLELADTARQISSVKPIQNIVIGAEDTPEIERLRASGAIDNAMTGKLPAGEFLNSLWQTFGRGNDDDAAKKISKPTSDMLDAGRNMFNRLDQVVAQGGIDPDTRRAITAAANSAVLLADDPSVAPMLNQLRGHHDYTFAHSMRVGILMASFGRAIGLGADHLRLMAETGLLHDLGKMKVPIAILAKPGKLNEEEWKEMNLHPVYGADLVKDGYADLPDLVAAVRHHHERLDGGGYPDGQAMGQIHEMSLCTAVVDVFSALTDRRDYKPSMPPEEAFAIMDRMSGPHLEPRLYKRFRELVLDKALADSLPPL